MNNLCNFVTKHIRIISRMQNARWTFDNFFFLSFNLHDYHLHNTWHKCLIYVVHDQRSRLHVILLELIYKDTTTLLLITMHNHFKCGHTMDLAL